ncbi:lysosomal thioesterase PPT2 homolog isoform X2 [Cylas formicarius]|uniref:lysosomal thioesterase PPT2 homolog isoform X2 n=1 Tax=Cylas formicarius TaxID=197179 RepID=UPI0029589E29|nr:lysosomal thioesterase PPT2 homolog isoform X2 [Cylas formicarius]
MVNKFVIFLTLLHIVLSYKPVILLHGILTGFESMELIKERIEKNHPGTIVYNIDRFGGWSSLDSMWYQVNRINENIINITMEHPSGVHLLGYSQGALLARTLLQANPNHSVNNFISLSGPQAGQYGK